MPTPPRSFGRCRPSCFALWRFVGLGLLTVWLSGRVLRGAHAAEKSSPEVLVKKVRGECIPTTAEYNRFRCYGSGSARRDGGNDADDDGSYSACTDSHPDCGGWSERGECQNNAAYMLAHCARSCDACVDGHAGVTQIAPPVATGLAEDEGDDPYDPRESRHHRRVLDRLERTREYLQDKVLANARYLHTCRNHHPLCAHRATLGECETDLDRMREMCPAACHRC
jgi:hypothetical protein